VARCQPCRACGQGRGVNACAGTSTETCSATSAPYESVILKFTRPNHRPSVERTQRFSKPGTRPVATRRPPGGGSSAPAVPSSGGRQNASRSIQTGRSNDGSGCACDADQGLYTASPSRQRSRPGEAVFEDGRARQALMTPLVPKATAGCVGGPEHGCDQVVYWVGRGDQVAGPLGTDDAPARMPPGLHPWDGAGPAGQESGKRSFRSGCTPFIRPCLRGRPNV
jgi:hypothetical protein